MTLDFPSRLPNAGWWGMVCWNGLSEEQQERLINIGNLPIMYEPKGWCKNGAQVAIEMDIDKAPGPRFYCLECSVEHIARRIRNGS